MSAPVFTVRLYGLLFLTVYVLLPRAVRTLTHRITLVVASLARFSGGGIHFLGPFNCPIWQIEWSVLSLLLSGNLPVSWEGLKHISLCDMTESTQNLS